MTLNEEKMGVEGWATYVCVMCILIPCLIVALPVMVVWQGIGIAWKRVVR